MVATKTTAKKRGIEETKSSRSRSKVNDSSDRRSVKKESYGYSDYPLGMRFLVFLCAFNALLFILLAFTRPYIMYFGLNLEGYAATLALLVSALCYVAVFFSILKRKRWAVPFVISWYAVNLVSSVVSLIFIDRTIIGILSGFFIFSLVITGILNLLVMWYVYHKRAFFEGDSFEKDHFKKSHFTKSDKVFMFIVITFVVFCAVCGGAVMFNTFSRLSHSVVTYGARLTEISDIDQGISYCRTADDPDLCLLSFSVISQNSQKGSDLVKVCGTVRSSFLRYTCFEGINVR